MNERTREKKNKFNKTKGVRSRHRCRLNTKYSCIHAASEDQLRTMRGNDEEREEEMEEEREKIFKNIKDK